MRQPASIASRRLLALGLFAVATSLACQQQDASSDDAGADTAGADAAATEIVAEIGGEKIGLAELDAFIRERLVLRRTQGREERLYELRRESLDEMINERLLEAEAARRGVEPDEALQLALAEKPVSEEEIAAFYLENESRMQGRPLEEMREAIQSHLERGRVPEIYAGLRRDASVSILLEPARIEVAADGPALGPADAPVTIVEFSDFQCPFCVRALPIVKELRERYPDQVRIVYRHLPLDRIHPRARAAAEAAVCAHDQGSFWEFHDMVFENNRALTDEDLERYAGEVGLDVAAFRQCVADGKFKQKVVDDVEAAKAHGITGTPAFVVNGILLSGAKPVDEFVSVIDRELARAGAEAPSGG